MIKLHTTLAATMLLATAAQGAAQIDWSATVEQIPGIRLPDKTIRAEGAEGGVPTYAFYVFAPSGALSYVTINPQNPADCPAFAKALRRGNRQPNDGNAFSDIAYVLDEGDTRWTYSEQPLLPTPLCSATATPL